MTSLRGAAVSGSSGLDRSSGWDLALGASPWLRAAVIAAVLVGSVLAAWRPSVLLLAAVVAAAGLLLILRRPAWGLVFLPVAGIAVPLEFKASASVAVNIVVLMIPLLLAVWVLGMVRRRALYLVPSVANAPFVGLVLSATASWLLGNIYWNPLVPRPGNVIWVQLGQWSIFAFSAIAFWLAANLATEVRWLKLVTYTYLAVGGALAALYVFPQMAPIVERLKPAGATTSAYWSWLTALALGQLLFNRRLPALGRLWCVLTLAALWYIAIVGLHLWLSGIVPMSVAAVVLIALRFREKALPFFLLLGLLAALAGPVVYQRSGYAEELEMSGGGRLNHYRFVLQFATQRPVFGLGMAAYRHYTWTVADRTSAVIYRGVQISAHNNYLDLFAQMGVVGLLAFAWLSVALARMVWRVSRYFTAGFEGAYANAAVAGLAATLISGLLGDWFLPFVYNIGLKGFRSTVMIWVLLGGVAALDWLRTNSLVSRE